MEPKDYSKEEYEAIDRGKALIKCWIKKQSGITVLMTLIQLNL